MENKIMNEKIEEKDNEVLAKQKIKFGQLIDESINDETIKKEYYNKQKELNPRKFDFLVAESMIVEKITQLRTSVLIAMQDYFYDIFYTKNNPQSKESKIVAIKGKTILDIIEKVIKEEIGEDEKNLDDYAYIVYESVMKWLDLEYIINNNDKQN